MRTVSKDIMMICKGWYLDRLSVNKREAVENYIREYLEMEPYSDCVVEVLYRSVRKIHESDALIAKYLVEQSQGKNRNLSVTDFMIGSLIHLLGFKVTLKMDLSDYKEIQDYVSGKDNIIIDFENMSIIRSDNSPWWIRFKNDEVEDDLQ